MSESARRDLIPVTREDDILPEWRGTPVGELLRYHNLGVPAAREYKRAEILVGMCMDNRKMLRIPDNFAFIVRAGGANVGRMEFKVSFAIAVGGVRAIALIGHSDCGMVRLPSRRVAFIRGLVENAGWTEDDAAAHWERHAPEFGIDDAAQFVRRESVRLRRRYPKIPVAPLFYTVEDGRLHHVREEPPAPATGSCYTL